MAHRCSEGFHDLTQGMLVAVYIIAIQLMANLPQAGWCIPIFQQPRCRGRHARLDMDNTRVRGGDRLDSLGGAIRGMIIDND